MWEGGRGGLDHLLLTSTKGQDGSTVGGSIEETNGGKGLPVVKSEVGALTDPGDPHGEDEEDTHQKLDGGKSPVALATGKHVQGLLVVDVVCKVHRGGRDNISRVYYT